jgi:hypothetical protein
MSIYTVTSEEMTSFADKIRTKINSTATLSWPTGFESALNGISGNGMIDTVTEFNQINNTVSTYLTAATTTYASDTNYTTTIITSYEDDNNSNLEKPLGYSLSITSAGTIYFIDETTGNGWYDTVSAGTYNVYNLIPNHIYRWWVKNSNNTTTQNGRIKSTGSLRMLYLQYPHNFRDLGGWSCDGGSIKYGLLYRGAQLSYNNGQIATIKDLERLHNLGIKYEIDLRTLDQTSGLDNIIGTSDDINTSPIGSDVYYLKFPYSDASYTDIVNLTGSYKT